MSYATELAKELKSRDNVESIGAILGVVTDSNNPTISILDGQVLLTKGHLYICSSLLKDCTRDFKIDNINGNTSSVNDGGQSASSHSHTITDLKGTLNITKDYLNVGDKVILVAIENGQKYFVLDKVVL